MLTLPPILDDQKIWKAKPTCSKAARGLFVQVEVGRVFTAIAISPSEPSRQLLARYAFHARLNSPDKELRYLRTVIVTAAVHTGLSKNLDIISASTLDLRALGRFQPIYLSLRFRTDLCF